MSFFRDLMSVPARRTLLAAAVATSMLAACGGGDQEETFQPSRIITVGDENSYIDPTGFEHTANNTTPVANTNPNGVACVNSPGWVEYVAANYGLAFAECFGRTPVAYARMLAQKGHKIADVRAALDTLNASSAPLNKTDLVTMAVGMHDLVALVEATPNPTTAQLATMESQAFALGQQLGDGVLAVIATGARILITTVPNLGVAPITVTVGTTPGMNAGVLSALSTKFNDGLNDRMATVPSGGGRNGAILEVDQLIETYRRNNDNTYSTIVDRVNAACAQVVSASDPDNLLGCTIANAGVANAGAYLWAGRLQFGAITHSLLGQEAVNRIKANPL